MFRMAATSENKDKNINSITFSWICVWNTLPIGIYTVNVHFILMIGNDLTIQGNVPIFIGKKERKKIEYVLSIDFNSKLMTCPVMQI